MIDSATGVSRTPPTACSPRPTMSQRTEGARAQKEDVTANRPSPRMNAFLRPNRSASDPLASRSVPRTSV